MPLHSTTELDPRWKAVKARDAHADSTFVFAVQTTGVFCRPSCPSRRAKPENVRFFDTPDLALAAGFRPCLRCNPTGQSAAEANAVLIAEACRIIEAADTPIPLDDLAKRIGLSAHYFHRQFKAITGLTPKAWQDAHRARQMRSELQGGGKVTQAIYASGYNSSSRFYEGAAERLGMTPSAYRAGGRDADIRFAVAACSLGAILIAESARGICAITLGDDPEVLVHDLQDRFPNARLIGANADFDRRVAEVVGLVEQPQLGHSLPLDLRGTAFQERVWQALLQVPAGKTISYAELARQIGSPRAVRAVAQACGQNRLAVAVPCHRVVRTDGDISGYRWGVERKRRLLARESADR